MDSFWYFYRYKCEQISQFFLIADFEQAHFIKNANTFEGEIKYIMHDVVVFSVWTKFINK